MKTLILLVFGLLISTASLAQVGSKSSHLTPAQIDKNHERVMNRFSSVVPVGRETRESVAIIMRNYIVNLNKTTNVHADSIKYYQKVHLNNRNDQIRNVLTEAQWNNFVKNFYGVSKGAHAKFCGACGTPRAGSNKYCSECSTPF